MPLDDRAQVLNRLLVPSPQSLSQGDPNEFAWVPLSGTCQLRIFTGTSAAPLEEIDLDLRRRQEYARVNAMADCLRTRYQQVQLVMDIDDGDGDDNGDDDDDDDHHKNYSATHSSSDEEQPDERQPSPTLLRIVGRIDGIGINGINESYTLDVNSDSTPWNIVAKDMNGLFYGIQTILQLLRVCNAYSSLWYDGTFTSEYATGLLSHGVRVPVLTIADWPVLPHRAYMKDIARCRIPTMIELYRMVDLMASLKYNQLQLYMEASYAYEQHEEVWKGTSPMTAEEIQLLDTYCHARCIELVPNQNSLGHMHRWLIHEKYSGTSASSMFFEDFYDSHLIPLQSAHKYVRCTLPGIVNLLTFFFLLSCFLAFLQ